MLDSGEIDYGVITDGLCDAPKAQAQFDIDQKGHAPISQ